MSAGATLWLTDVFLWNNGALWPRVIRYIKFGYTDNTCYLRIIVGFGLFMGFVACRVNKESHQT